MKNIAVVIAGSNQIRDLTIKPGTTAENILAEVNIPAGTLSKGGNEGPFAPKDNVYEAVQDGAKLYASTAADVGIVIG